MQARGLGDARPRAGVRVSLVARNNDVLGEAETDSAGLARFAGPLLRGEGGVAPVALHAQQGEDLVSLDLEAASFDLSDRGVTGRAWPGPVDAFLWLDRGVYRPGEAVRLSVLPRDAAGRVVDLPIRLRLRRPNGQVALEAVPERGPEGAVLLAPRSRRGAGGGLDDRGADRPEPAAHREHPLPGGRLRARAAGGDGGAGAGAALGGGAARAAGAGRASSTARRGRG